MTREKLLILGGLALLALLFVSGLRPYDRATWWMEVAPVIIAVPILVATYRVSQLTTLLYCLSLARAVILIVGGTYTYARVPIGFWLQDVFALGRNPYDKIRPFMQGFEPAILVRGLS